MGRKNGLMDRMSGTSPDQVDVAVAAAQRAWDAGWLTHTYVVSALGALDQEGLGNTLEWFARIGWSLRSSAVGTSTAGPNMVQAVFVFTRPDARP